MLFVKHHSFITYNGVIFATGSGTSEDPSECIFKLPQTGQYVLYVAYKGTGSSITFEFETQHSSIPDVWYPVLKSDFSDIYSLEIAASDNANETQRFRIPIVDPTIPLYFPPSESFLKIKVYGTTLDGSMSLNLMSATRPSESPYTVTSAVKILIGSLEVLTVDDEDAEWKIYGDSSYFKSGDPLRPLRENTAVGNQKILVKWTGEMSDQVYDVYVSEGVNLQSLEKQT